MNLSDAWGNDEPTDLRKRQCEQGKHRDAPQLGWHDLQVIEQERMTLSLQAPMSDRGGV